LVECQAIETKWNNFCNTYFTTIDDKYPSTDLAKVDLDQGTKLIQNAATRVVSKHATSNRPLYTVMTVDLDVIEVADEEISALRIKGHVVDIDDNWIHNDFQIMLNSQRMIVGVMAGTIPIADLKQDEGLPADDPPVAADPDLVTTKGLTTLLAEDKVTLRTHEGHMQYGDYVREELIVALPS
jgi:hypothetical protein